MKTKLFFELFACINDHTFGGSNPPIFSKTIEVDWPDIKYHSEGERKEVVFEISASIKTVDDMQFHSGKLHHYKSYMTDSSHESMERLKSLGWVLDENAAKQYRYPRTS